VIPKQWPFKLRPHREELLSSFLTRSAHAHGSSPYIFLNLFWPGYPIWTRDIDRDPDLNWLKELAAICGTPAARLFDCTLNQYRMSLAGKLNRNGDTPLLLSASIYHQTRKRHALQYCSICLGGRSPYYRRSWRLGFVLMCDEHMVSLRDACPSCDAPVIPHRSLGVKLHSCHSCMASLVTSDTPSVSAAVSDFQKQLMALLSDHSGARIGPFQGIDAFRVSRILISICTDKPAHSLIRTALGLPALSEMNRDSMQLERARWHTRHLLIETVAHWLSDWPYNFHQGANKARLTQQRFIRLSLPISLRSEVNALPRGFSRNRRFVSILDDVPLRRLRRRDIFEFKRVRGERLLRAAK